jgi:hypothetical protein
MKRMLLALVVVGLLVGLVGATSLNFQDYGDMSSVVCSDGIGTCTWIQSINGNNNYIHDAPAGGFYFIQNKNSLQMTYAAATALSSSASFLYVRLYDSSHATLYTNPAFMSGAGRYEVEVVGGTATIYKNGIKVYNSTPLSVNPSYIGFGTVTGTTADWDDIVYGDAENKYIFGNPEPGAYILKKDFVTPASTGFAFANGTIVSSNNMSSTWGKSNITYLGNETIVIQNVDTGTIYGTRYTRYASSGNVTWALADEIFNSGAPYGRYYVTIPGTGAVSEEIWYLGSGATISFDEDTYSGQDTATMTYSVLGAYWDTSTYSYSIDVVSGTTGATMQSTAISSSSGTEDYTFTSTDPLGVYYAIVKATKYSDGSVIWMNYDYAELTSYVTIEGYVVDAETGLPISGANINITQNSIINNLTTIADGNYSATNYLSDAPITINATAPLHRQYTYTFTPLIAKTIDLNISLVNITPTVDELGIGGVAHDSAYGQPLAGTLATGENLTHTVDNVSTFTGYYLLGEGDLLNESYYNVSGSKAGYSNSSIGSVYVNGSISNFTHQDLWLAGQYLQTFTITDSGTLAAITNVTIVSSSGKTYVTTNGTGYLTEPFGLYTITFSSDGYYPRTISYVFDADASHAVALTETGAGATDINLQGTPKDVKFHIQSFWGEPIQNANVTVQGISTTTGSWDWVATLLSIDLAETPIQNTSMSGFTDTNGDAVFLMLASLKYNITVSKAGYTFPLTYISPQASQYPISANMNESWFSAGNDTLKEVNVSVSWITKNATHAFVNITYQDDTGTTTGGDVKVYQRSAGRAVNASPIAVMNVTASSCSNSTVVEVPTGGASYVVDVNATTSTGTNIKRTFAHDFKGQPVNLPGFTPETQLWLAMFILIFTAAFAGVLHAPQISIVLCVELWAFWAIRWFDHLIDGNGFTEVVLVTMFILATFAAFVWNITEGKSKGKRSS